jgi:RND family efflux transporter MFP subunit
MLQISAESQPVGRRLGYTLGLFCAGALAATACGCGAKSKVAATPKSPEVVVDVPTIRSVTEYEEFSGRTEASFSVDIRARVTGYLDRLHFKDGVDVNQGDLLFTIDARTYQADLDKADAQVEQTKAHLQRIKNDYQRGTVLLQKKVITQQEADLTIYDRAETEAALAAANAARETAALNVGFTRVAAPISGRISRRNIDPGNLIKADDTVLTSIVALDPLYAYFDIDERTMLRLRRLEAEGKIKTTSGSNLAVQVGLADEEGFSLAGSIDFTDNRVDPNTGTLRVRAVIANPRKVLAPGLFIRLRLPIGNPRPATLVPEEAISSDQGQRFLYVVNENDEAVYRRVKCGPLEDGLRVIESGLAPGERVVVNGLQRVRGGTKVRPVLMEKPPANTATQKVAPIKQTQDASRSPARTDRSNGGVQVRADR